MAYGNTINFQAGPTDTGLHEYIRVSQLWQKLLRVDATSTKRRRALPSDGDEEFDQTPLPQRLANLRIRRDCRWHRSTEEVRVALEHVYGPGAFYRTVEQGKAVQAVTADLTPIIVVMGARGGKSLLYILQQRLSGAGTTIPLVPLVALKRDTVRRCRQMGVECRIWDGAAAHAGLGDSLVIVSLDQAIRSSRIRAYLRGLESAGQLDSIMFDECHLALTAANYLQSIIRRITCSIVWRRSHSRKESSW